MVKKRTILTEALQLSNSFLREGFAFGDAAKAVCTGSGLGSLPVNIAKYNSMVEGDSSGFLQGYTGLLIIDPQTSVITAVPTNDQLNILSAALTHAKKYIMPLYNEEGTVTTAATPILTLVNTVLDDISTILTAPTPVPQIYYAAWDVDIKALSSATGVFEDALEALVNRQLAGCTDLISADTGSDGWLY